MDSSINIDRFLNAREATTYDELLAVGNISNADVRSSLDRSTMSALHKIPEIAYCYKAVNPDNLCCYILTCYIPGEVNVRDSFGHTPMLSAALYNSPGALKILMDFGGDRNLKSDYNESPLYWAKRENHQEIVKMLTERFPSEM